MHRLLAMMLAAAALSNPAQAWGGSVYGDTADTRPCIDYVGRGSIRSTGTPEPLNIPDDMLGHSVYRYRFIERATLFGHPPAHVESLMRSGHSLAPIAFPDVAVFMTVTGKRQRFLGWQWVWKDHQGRAFIPVFYWPDEDSGWMPMAIRRFARSVSYRDPQQYWRGLALSDDQGDDPDLFVTRHERTYVRYGLYLSDIPAMLRAARGERCSR